MRTARLVAAAAALALLAAPAALAQPRFELRHVDVDDYPTIRLVVHSADRGVRPKVYENGAPVHLVTSDNLGASKAIVLALDRSKSMRGEPLTKAAAAASELLRRKRQADQVELVSFGSTAIAQTSFSQSTIDADNALHTLATDNQEGTALYDAIVVASANLKAQGVPGRVLVLLTDGHDVRSLATFSNALRAAKRAGVVVYTIALGDAATRPLKQLAAGTGGSFYASATPATLGAVYRRVAADLDHIWRVSYTTRARPADWIEVAIAGSKTAQRVQLPGDPSTEKLVVIPSVLLRGAGGLLLLAAIVGLLLMLATREARALPRAERIRRLVRDHTDGTAVNGRDKKRERTLADVVAALNFRLRRVPQMGRIERLVEATALPASAGTLLVGSVSLGFVLALLAAVAASSTVVILFLFALGVVAPLVGVKVLAIRRVRAFDEQLPDVLATVASSLRAGHGLKAALQTVASDGSPPMSVEMRRVLSEARLGLPLEQALISMCERIGSEDLVYVANAVEVQQQVGGSLAEVFDTVANTVRERQQHRRRLRALTSSGRATATVLALMPVAFVVLMLLVSPDYMRPFLSSGVGHVLMFFSFISISIGGFLLHRIVSVGG